MNWISAAVDSAIAFGHRGPISVQSHSYEDERRAAQPREMSSGGIGSQLLALDLASCLNLTDISIEFICDFIPQLRALSVSGCTQLSPDAFHRLLSSGSPPQLSYLDARHTSLTKSSLWQLPPTLTHLLLTKCTRIDKIDIGAASDRAAAPPPTSEYAAQWSRATQYGGELRIRPDRVLLDFAPISEDVTNALAPLSMLENFPYCSLFTNLVAFHCASNPQLHEVHLSAPHLTVLNLSQCQQLRKLVLFTPSLTSLNLQSCSSLSELEFLQSRQFDRTRLTTSQSLSLITVNLQHCRSIPLDALLQIGSRSANLQEAILNGVLQMSDPIMHVWLMNCTNLRFVRIEGCTSISAAMTDSIAAKSLAQHQLHLMRQAQFADDSDYDC